MLYIIQNDPDVPPGSITDHLPVPWRILHPYRDNLFPPIEEISALIVLGGAMGANDDRKHPFLADLKTLIRTVVAKEIPYFGVCLGGQLLAASLGAKVATNRWEELGNLSATLTSAGQGDLLFRGIPPDFAAFQWHHDSFDLPDEGVLLASSAICPHQAFRVGTSAWGVQFHPEVTEEIIRCWCSWDKATSGRTDEFITGFRAEAETYRAVVSRMVSNFLLKVRPVPVSS